MTISKKTRAQDLYLLDEDDQQIFEALKDAILSEGDQTPQASASKIDSLLRGSVGTIAKSSINAEEEVVITATGVSSQLGIILAQTAMQVPIEEEKQHQKLAEVIIALTNISTEVKDGEQAFFWSDLPFIEGELEDQWHRES